jgi:hypothetical protein
MKTSRLLFALLCTLVSFSLYAQIDLKLQLLPDGTRWGVYAVTQPGTSPSTNTITGSGQVTIVAPLGFNIVDLTPVNGNWANNATIAAPVENPSKVYYSIGLVSDQPQIIYSTAAPVLLFTFKKVNCPSSLYLIDNDSDPFAEIPNSASTNPGNELSVFDAIGAIYNYDENLAPFAWDCNDCDSDGIANALEDTNGDGQWTPGVDVSDLCNGGGTACTEITAALLRCENGGTACGNNPAGPLNLAVDITGGTAPFTVKYRTGANVFTLQNYQSGTPFQVAATNGALYELVEVKGADACVADVADLSGTVPVTIAGTVQFTTQPVNASTCNGSEAMFTVCASANNTTFNFGWQYSSDNGATWQPVPMGLIYNQTNTSTAASGCDNLIVGSTFGLQGYRFRAVVQGANLPATYSDAASIQVLGPVAITSQPQAVSACGGGGASFTANVANNGAGSLNYQWQQSLNGGQTWSDVVASTTISGVNTPNLNISSTSGMSSRMFRLQANLTAGNCPAVTSQPAMLTVESTVEILAVVSPVALCRGEEACFEVQATQQGGGQLTYQWQERSTANGTWADIQGATASVLCIANTEGRNGHCFRAIVGSASTACSASLTSAEACLVVEASAVFAQQPQSTATCFGEAATLSANAALETGYAGNLGYQWQSSNDGGLTWADLADDAFFAGATTASLNINQPAAAAGQLFRLAATTGICEATYSEAASVAVEGPIGFGLQPSDVRTCENSPSAFKAVVTYQGNETPQLQWQWSDNGTDWADVVDDSSITGAQTDSLHMLWSNENGRQFRLRASTTACGELFSEVATYTVLPNAQVIQQPASVTTCRGEAVSFEVLHNVTDPNIYYAWITFINNIATELHDDGNFSGTHTNVLTVNNPTENGRFYMLAISQNYCGGINSNIANLTVEQPVGFDLQPQTVAVCPDDATSFSTIVSNGNGAQLQWQSSTNGSAWADVAEGGNYAGTKTPTLHIAEAAGLGGRQFRLKAASQICGETVSNPATLQLQGDNICNPGPVYEDCVKLSVKLLANGQGWGVWAKAANDFTETPYQLPTGGRVTLVAPVGFTFTDFTSIAGGKWKYGLAMLNPAQDPGKIYMEFVLEPNQNFLNLEPGGEIMLFRFKRVGPCPSSLVLMNNIVPPGFSPNQFTGFGAGDGSEVHFQSCGVYAQGQWSCPGGWNLVAQNDDDDTVEGVDVEIKLTDLEVDEEEAVEDAPAASFFGVAPNPAHNEVSVRFEASIAKQNATLRLWNLQGQTLKSERTDGSGSHRFDLNGMVPGTYFLSLEVDGKVLQREKLIVF